MPEVKTQTRDLLMLIVAVYLTETVQRNACGKDNILGKPNDLKKTTKNQ